MSLKDVAEELVAGCREGRTRENLDKLYAEDAVSVEATAGPDGSRKTQGRAGIAGKHDWWDATFTVHGGDVQGPFMHGDDRFAVIFEIDAENKQSGERTEMKEVAVYHVRDGRIVREEFFYAT